MNARLAPLAIAIALTSAACASASDGIEVVDSVVTNDTEVSDDDSPAVTFLSEPVDAGSLFGNAARQEAVGDAATDPAQEPCFDDEQDCSTLRPDVLPSVNQFVPSPEDEPFCALLAELEDRPFPSDEDEALVVVLAWFGELQPTVPPAFEEDFALLMSWLEAVMQSQGQLGFDELDPDVEGASDRLGDFVETNCYGDGVDIEERSPIQPATTNGTPRATSGSDERRAGPIFGDEARNQFEQSGVPSLSPIERRAIDESFCALVDEIAQRVMPRGDVEQMVVAQTWLAELAPVVPESIVEQYATVSSWVDGIVEAQRFEEPDEPDPGDAVDLAIEDLNTYVDAKCYGY